ncbi:hypothetical protein EC970246_D0004 [Escherichia coli 97.0246]|uniref:Uncharacterized protein n=1 Tax=Escherichia coli 97.0246 TaxID=869670 RepID=A0A8E0KTS0_ECOLX|nr:hypothetical protein EC970246_D0004 [Escherichia coli 97.0246]
MRPPPEPGHRKTTARCLPSSLSDSGYSRWRPADAVTAVPVSAASRNGQPAHPGRPAASIPPVVYPHSVPVTGHVHHQ